MHYYAFLAKFYIKPHFRMELFHKVGDVCRELSQDPRGDLQSGRWQLWEGSLRQHPCLTLGPDPLLRFAVS